MQNQTTDIEPPESAFTDEDWAEAPVINPHQNRLNEPTPLVGQLIRLFAQHGDDDTMWVPIGNVGRWNESAKVAGIRDQLRQFSPNLYLKLMDHTGKDGNRVTLARLTAQAYSR